MVAGSRIVLALGLGTVPLAAQSPEQRRQLDAFRDTLQLVSDTNALRERESLMLPSAARSRDQPFSHLYMGTLAMRQGELGGLAHFEAAAAEFRWAARLAPQWPYAWAGAGVAELALAARLATAANGSQHRTRFSSEALSRATVALARAVSLEPELASRLEGLSRQALREGSRNRVEAIRDALVRAGGRNGPVLLALGRIQRELGDTASIRTFTTLLASGQHRPIALLELGRTQLFFGDLSGRVRYYAAAAEPDPAARAELRADLESVADSAWLAEFDRREGPARADLVRRFWTSRDRLELLSDGERLAEHLRRLAVARREYGVTGPAGAEPVDQRGLVYIRHGPPDERATLARFGVEPNESWSYHDARGAPSLVLHFAARGGPVDFRLIESLLDLRSPTETAPPSRDAAAWWSRLVASPLFRSRSTIHPLYREPPGRPGELARFLERERSLGRSGARVALSSDRYRLRFGRPVEAIGATVVTGGVGPSPVVQVAFAVPARAASPSRVGQNVVYPVRVRFVALDSQGNVAASVDSQLRISHREELHPEQNLIGRVVIPVRSGQLVANSAIQTGAKQGMVLLDDSLFKLWKDGFIGLNLGSSAAQSVLLMAVVIGLTMLQFRYAEKKVTY